MLFHLLGLVLRGDDVEGYYLEIEEALALLLDVARQGRLIRPIGLCLHLGGIRFGAGSISGLKHSGRDF